MILAREAVDQIYKVEDKITDKFFIRKMNISALINQM